jgi:hypothetical protein
MHYMCCVALWFTMRSDSFRGVLFETVVDLNLGHPRNGSKSELNQQMVLFPVGIEWD